MSYNNSPYPEGGSGFNESSTGFIQPSRPAPPRKKALSPWVKFGVPVAIVIIIAAIIGGVVGSKKSSGDEDGDSSSSSNSGSDGSSNGGKDGKDSPKATGAIATATEILEAGRFATTTNAQFMVPVYPSATNTALWGPPTISSGGETWPQDPFAPANPDPLTVRTDRPRLIAPAYKWAALPDLIAADPYLKGWNDTIFKNATDYHAAPVIRYNMDGDSGILDNAREFKMRIKAWGYAWRLTQDTKWADRAYQEITHVSSPQFQDPNNPEQLEKWHPRHFLDTAEFSAAFGIAYDWFYDIWSDDQKAAIRDSLIRFGLNHGRDVYTGTSPWAWWQGDHITGNWNCVCNGGLTLGALAILGDDTTGVAEVILRNSIDNAKGRCTGAVVSDGSWIESPHYWYFGTTGHAEMASALLSATGSHHGLLDVNPNFWKTGLFHMYLYGPTSIFDFADHGPNKFSTTANSMLFYGDRYAHPEFILHQREQVDAADPWSMFWYNPAVKGAFWNGLPLDHYFDAPDVQWASMRSSWTDDDALFFAIKAGTHLNHQTHNDLDAGTFVLDALGTRWAGELGSGDYLSTDYFNAAPGREQESERWKYYRKHTMGQNTILVNKANQNVNGAPTANYGSSETRQGSSTIFDVPNGSTAFFTTDMSSSYFDATTVKRGGRLLNNRRQVLLQDEINAQQPVEWRMHTNATVTIDSSGTSATLSLDNETMHVTMLDPPSGARFSTQSASRGDVVPAPAFGDQENPGVTVLTIALGAGEYTLRVLFNPQWPGMKASDFVTPSSVPIDNWSLTSHD